MPMMADLHDPPQSRAKGILVGIAIATPVVLGFFGYVLPILYSMIVGGAASADQRIELETAYMQALCTSQAMELPRDKALCECTLASDLPGIDCRFVFDAWTLQRQAQQCADPDAHAQALSFCTCVQELHTLHEAAADKKERGLLVGRYRRCAEFEDALYLPSIEQLQAAKDAKAGAS